MGAQCKTFSLPMDCFATRSTFAECFVLYGNWALFNKTPREDRNRGGGEKEDEKEGERGSDTDRREIFAGSMLKQRFSLSVCPSIYI